jgi:chromosome segregation ATPase
MLDVTQSLLKMEAADKKWSSVLDRLRSYIPDLRTVWDSIESELFRDNSEVEELRGRLEIAEENTSDLRKRLQRLYLMAEVLSRMDKPDRVLVKQLADSIGDALDYACNE